jgi:hypothetical protein
MNWLWVGAWGNRLLLNKALKEWRKPMTHDTSEYIRGLQQLLISGKKKIDFLFGAGTSLDLFATPVGCRPSPCKMHGVLRFQAEVG